MASILGAVATGQAATPPVDDGTGDASGVGSSKVAAADDGNDPGGVAVGEAVAAVSATVVDGSGLPAADEVLVATGPPAPTGTDLSRPGREPSPMPTSSAAATDTGHSHRSPARLPPPIRASIFRRRDRFVDRNRTGLPSLSY